MLKEHALAFLELLIENVQIIFDFRQVFFVFLFKLSLLFFFNILPALHQFVLCSIKNWFILFLFWIIDQAEFYTLLKMRTSFDSIF
jgi:hypothetical protein